MKKGILTMVHIPVGRVEVKVLQHFLPEWGSRIGCILGLIQVKVDMER
jgi:hypothetical protein